MFSKFGLTTLVAGIAIAGMMICVEANADSRHHGHGHHSSRHHGHHHSSYGHRSHHSSYYSQYGSGYGYRSYRPSYGYSLSSSYYRPSYYGRSFYSPTHYGYYGRSYYSSYRPNYYSYSYGYRPYRFSNWSYQQPVLSQSCSSAGRYYSSPTFGVSSGRVVQAGYSNYAPFEPTIHASSCFNGTGYGCANCGN